MKTIYYFVRHGETPNNVKQIWQGRNDDCGLTEKGKAQALKAARILEQEQIERIYSSPYRRAKETADIISMNCDVPLISNVNLREIDYGVADGKPFDEVMQTYPKISHLWLNPRMDNFDNHFEGGESLWDGLKRMYSFMDSVHNFQVSRGYIEWNVGVVSHGGILGALLASLEANFSKINNGDVIVISRDDLGYKFETMM